MNKNIELAKKLKALSDKGVGGEKINAEKMLSDLMKKHNITIEEIEGEKLNDYFFKIEPKNHKIWYQIVKRVNHDIKCYGEFPKKVIKEHYLKGNYMITSTASEYIEIEAKYNFYKKLYEEEVDVFFTAFCKANDLLVSRPNSDDNNKDEDYTQEELEKYIRMTKLANNIKVGHFKKQISQNNG